jgi:hypothetical protein
MKRQTLSVIAALLLSSLCLGANAQMGTPAPSGPPSTQPPSKSPANPSPDPALQPGAPQITLPIGGPGAKPIAPPVAPASASVAKPNQEAALAKCDKQPGKKARRLCRQKVVREIKD